MRVIVLEPNGEHWLAEMPPERVHRHEPLVMRGEVTSNSPRPTEFGIPFPTYALIHYEGIEFRDANGTSYWIYSRKRGY